MSGYVSKTASEDLASKMGYAGEITAGAVALADASTNNPCLITGFTLDTAGATYTGTTGQEVDCLVDGTGVAIAGAAIAEDAWVVSNGAGKWITATAGDLTNAKAESAAAGDGSSFTIRIARVPSAYIA